MNRQLILKVALILFLSAGPSAACDPEEMINELRAQCRGAITSAVALIEPMKPTLTALDRNMVEAKVKEATLLCNSDKYSEGYIRSRQSLRASSVMWSHVGALPLNFEYRSCAAFAWRAMVFQARLGADGDLATQRERTAPIT
jgi:hypothetical protein